MNSQTQRVTIQGPAGLLACAIDEPVPETQWRGVAVICHPNPTQGGTLDNKVVQTVARAVVQLGYRAVRFNFRGVGGSEGVWDEGRGEIDDCMAVVEQYRLQNQALILAGFSFGGYVATHAAQRVGYETLKRLLLVGPATSRFQVAAVPADTAVIHGELDDVVPLQAVLDWARPQSLPITVVPGVGHFFHGQLPLLKNLVLRALA